MRKLISFILILLFTAVCASCGSIPEQKSPEVETEVPAGQPAPVYGSGQEPEMSGEKEEMNLGTELRLVINDTGVTVDWEDNPSVDALRELVSSGPLTVQMSMYGGFEQVGPLGADLPRSDKQTVTQAGDIVLYSGDQIVLFYGSNSWAYTRLGRITDLSADEMAELLGSGDVTITLCLE